MEKPLAFLFRNLGRLGVALDDEIGLLWNEDRVEAIRSLPGYSREAKLHKRLTLEVNDREESAHLRKGGESERDGEVADVIGWITPFSFDRRPFEGGPVKEFWKKKTSE